MLIAIALRYSGREYYTEVSGETSITFGSHKKDNIQIENAKDHQLQLKFVQGDVQVVAQPPLYVRSSTIDMNTMVSLDYENGSKIYVSRITGRSSAALNLPYNGRITCGRRSNNDLILTYPIVSGNHFQIICESGKVHIEDLNSTNHLYLNGRRISKAAMKSGDVLSIYTFRFVLENGVLYFENMGSALKFSESMRKMIQTGGGVVHGEAVRPKVKAASTERKAGPYLQYQLSPRIREQLPSEPIILSSAPGQGPTGSGRRGNLAFMISSGAMMAASLATGMLSPSTLLMRAAGMISPLTNMAMYGKMSKEEKKQIEEYEQMRQERYQAYIDDQKARIKKVADVQRRVVTQENPVPAECIKTVVGLKRNLWERMAQDSDFLVTRLGLGKNKLCVEVKTRADMDGFHMEDDELEQLSGRIIEETRYVDHMPVCVPLHQYQTVGIVGTMEQKFYQLRSLLVTLTTQHNYKDVHLVGIFDHNSQKYWGLLRWLPHIWDETGQVRYIAFDQDRRHTVCELLNDLVRRRTLKDENESVKKDKMVLPHYIIIVENQELIQDEPIYEELIGNNPSLGMTTLFLGDSFYDLPQTCQYLIDLTEKPYAFEREKYDERNYFNQDEPIHQAEMEAFTRRMAAVELKTRNAEADIPSAISFLQGYKVETVEQLRIMDRWERSETYKSLAAPIGMMAGGKIFSLDVRSGEKSHGPHGLLAGTTGSGKSELLQTWILSMAVNYHPHDVNFVVIDYKGGGMSDLLEPLPHVVGSITNIDRNIGRSLVALKSELRRREELFSECGVNNIDKYHRAYQNGDAKVRLPHLIIVTDEFAEMKKEEPEFMTELNSLAAKGRSLGMHMLLATQKPAGVVNDQINSNSRFRICMKVQDVADSREMLKRPDAARITQSGRAYVRVGEDELFELFQSFYSAAEYTSKKNDAMNGENQVRIVGVTGNRINPIKKKVRKNVMEVDELTAIVRHMNEICEQNNIAKMDGPWLPELPKWLTLSELGMADIFDGEKWPVRRTGFAIPVGKYDIPELQKQGVQYLDFMETGHFAVYGSPGSGKTTLLKTVMTTIGLYYSPQDVEIMVLDAAGWSLSEFKNMPHVKEVILNQESLKIHNFVLRMNKELDARKHAFLKHSINSLSAYRETVSQDMPAILIMVDQLAPLFEQYMELEELLMDVATSGAPYGIYLIYTSNSSAGFKYKFTQVIKGCIALQLQDMGEYAGMVGRTMGVCLPNVPGRALLRGNPPVAFHTVMYADAAEEAARHESVDKITRQMQKAYQRQASTGLGQQPNEEITNSSSVQRLVQEHGQRNHLPIGNRIENLEPIDVDLSEEYLLLISSDQIQKRRTVMNNIASIFEKRKDTKVMHITKDNWEDSKDYLVNLLNERKAERISRKKNADFDEQNWLKELTQICVMVDELPEVSEAFSKEGMKAYKKIFNSATGLGVIVIASGDAEKLAEKEANMVVHAAVSSQNVLAFGKTPAEHRCFRLEGYENNAGTQLQEKEAAYMKHGQIQIVRYL